MNKHTLTLLDGSSKEVRIPADTLMALISALLEGARHATRFAVEGRSSRSGPRPAWLDAACRIEVTGLEAGSTVLKLEAPVLEEVAPERFPGELGDSPSARAGASSVDLFAEVLSAALTGPADRIDGDRALLDSCVRFGHLAQEAGGDLRLEGLTLPRKNKVVVSRTDIPRLEILRDQTPPPRTVRFSAQLDTISANRAEVTLLGDGHKVSAHLEEHDPERLVALFGKQVVVSGMARFSPSGRVLLIDADYLGEARPMDAVFSRVPDAGAWRQSLLMESQSRGYGAAPFFGTWPGDESDAELMASLKALG